VAVPPAWKDIFEHSGALQMAAVAAKDANLASLLTEGILMEVLSWKMYKEEPGACSLISQALNAGQQLALQTSELTALAVLTGRVGLELEGAVASQVSFETVKEKVRTELDQFVDMPDFISLFEFVVNMGANRSSFIKQLLAFWKQVRGPEAATAPSRCACRGEQVATWSASLQDRHVNAGIP
jgi:hypothetical protein